MNTKEKKYTLLNKEIKSLVSSETNFIANLANVCAAIKTKFNFFWVGFYLVEGNELILGPFQGTIACTRIQKGKGVCGTAWKKNKSIIVDDVDKFEGHIACSSLSKSEIVIPLRNKEKVIGVLDVDHDKYKFFDSTDKKYLKKIINKLEQTLD
ncbi:MAG: diguanylate cyclase [Cytophagia bacterium]|nr:diguanylate cyclase [Cytophagia bacterium]